MKLAHHLRKRDSLTLSQALTLAWDRAKREPFYWIMSRCERKTNRAVKTNVNSSSYQDMMIAYYNRGSSAYYGD